VLALRSIDKSYGPLRALAGVSLTVARGETVLLVGRNGAGKSTLIRIATGFLDADAGTVEIDGISLERDRSAAQSRLGYLPEHAPAPVELTVVDHLRLRARQKGLDAKRAAAAIDGAATAADIVDVLARPIGALSKGYRQRVGLADALLGAPSLLILDEPTSGMDPVQTRALCEQLGKARAERAVLISSHAVADLKDLADRVVVIHAGKVIAEGTPSALREQTTTESLDAAVLSLLGGAA
jgi:ABC-2 type transport system ATP-binding protein